MIEVGNIVKNLSSIEAVTITRIRKLALVKSITESASQLGLIIEFEEET